MKFQIMLPANSTLFCILLLLSVSLVSNNSMTSKINSRIKTNLQKETIINSQSDSFLEEENQLKSEIKSSSKLGDQPQFYMISKIDTPFCISAKLQNNKLTQQMCQYGNKVLWTFTRFRTGYIIRNRNGKVIDIAGQGRNKGNHVYGYNQNNSPAQIWSLEALGRERFRIKNIKEKKCIEDIGRNRNGYYHSSNCSPSNKNQIFLISPVDPPTQWYNIVGKTGLCLSARLDHNKLTQQKCGDSRDLLWTYKPFINGYIIVSRNGKVIDNSNEMKNNGNPVWGYYELYSAAQNWSFQSIGNKRILIKNI